MALIKHHKVVSALPAQLETDSIYYVRAGTGVDIYVTNSAGVVVAYPTNADAYAKLDAQLMHVQDQKAPGVFGGTFTYGGWRTRDLNTVLINTIAGASLASNLVTLPAGTYDVSAHAPAIAVDTHMACLTVNGVQKLLGSSEGTLSGTLVSTCSRIQGRLVLPSASQIGLQHCCATTRTEHGFGYPSALAGAHEAYSDLRIQRIA